MIRALRSLLLFGFALALVLGRRLFADTLALAP
jgi:hypothetical protein